VEQNARQALAIADRGYLLENGRIVGAGPAGSLAEDAAVQKAYLGGVAAVAASSSSPPRSAVPVSTSSVPTVGAEQLIQTSIDELIGRAAAIQSEHLRASRPPQTETPRAPAVPHAGADSALRDAIAEIEAAAARARGERQ
jgi:branched-chain amino acid transport system ATP-binding protein